MELFREVLLEVWREACQHIEIGESAARVLPLLRRQMAVVAISVRLIDTKRGGLDPVATVATGGGSTLEARTECTAEELTALLNWCKMGQAALIPARTKPSQALAQAFGVSGNHDVLVGPLNWSDERFAILALHSDEGHRFTERDQRLAGVLLEPFAAAVRNDCQLREITFLREAAEADKRSLLRKLGREKVGDTIIGDNSGLRAVMERVELVARSDVPTLILGETGSGKELIARTIHARSPRAEGPFLRINCGAIPPELIDSQLFGHEKGAFTGAVESRKGWFERADGGTLFLDEIGELPAPAQVRLLRVLQDGWLERVGGTRPLRVDVRVVAATHRDLARMVAEGRFREDLWYRIAVFPILLPPLRERRVDIEPLAMHFARRAATRFGLRPILPNARDLHLLGTYDWPGNVRELAAVIDRAAILGNGQTLEIAAALGGAHQSGKVERQDGTAAPSTASSTTGERLLSLNEVMRQHIERALRTSKGRVEGPFGAAAMLEINPHTLRARMRKLGIDWKRFRPS